MNQNEIINKLSIITSDYNFIYVIAGICLKDFCGRIEDIKTPLDGQSLNYNEAAFLIGLWIKNSNNLHIENYDFEGVFLETYKLMDNLHFSFITEGPKILDYQGAPSDFMLNSIILREAFFYSSTGAYDIQYTQKIEEKYKRDDSWFKSNKGFSINDLNSYFIHVKKLLHKKLNNQINYLGIKNIEDILNIFLLNESELFSNNIAYKNITNCFLIEPGTDVNSKLSSPGDFNEFQARPIIKNKNNFYFIPITFFLAEALYESPYYWMMNDVEYKKIGLQNRGLATEEIVYKLLKKIFGKENTFHGIKIKVTKEKTLSDIDVCVKYLDKLIIVQTKSKKLTSLSKQGDIDKIKEDFSLAIESAFKQSLICEKAILDKSSYFFENSNGKREENLFTNVKEIYKICVVLDSYPGLSHLSHILLYDKHQESTICFSIFDLEIICAYLNTPEKFIDYIIKRINNCRKYHSENEICYLGFYLNHDLKDHEGFNCVMVDNDFGTQIDREYYPKLYKNIKDEKIGRNDICPCGSNLKFKKCHGRFT
jgi:hypothetical protein